MFDDLAQEGVITCRRSLTAASDVLAAKKDKGMDARLFLVRHLLILKEMTAGLELGRRDRRRDWQGITGKFCIISVLQNMKYSSEWLISWACADFLKALLDNAGTMLGYARGSIVKASDQAPDAKTVRPSLNTAVPPIVMLIRH